MSKSRERSRKRPDGLDSDLEARRLAELVNDLPEDRRERLMTELQQEGYKPADVAKILGKPVATIHRWLREGQLQGTRIGRSWIVSKRELDRILGRN